MPKQHKCSSAKLSVGRNNMLWAFKPEVHCEVNDLRSMEANIGKYIQNHSNIFKCSCSANSERSEPCTGYISDRSQTFTSQRGNLRSQRFCQVATGTNASRTRPRGKNERVKLRSVKRIKRTSLQDRRRSYHCLSMLIFLPDIETPDLIRWRVDIWAGSQTKHDCLMRLPCLHASAIDLYVESSWSRAR